MKKRGIIAGAFDVLHPGYIKAFKEAKKYCDHLVIALHSDPSIERPEKMKPVLSLEDRKEILDSIRFIDEILEYSTEKELKNILVSGNIDIRFLGDDYKVKDRFTGSDLEIPIRYFSRDHGWSATKYKKLIAGA